MKRKIINLHQLRTMYDVKPGSLAENLGITTSQLAQIESKGLSPDSKLVAMLQRIFPKVKFHWFTEYTAEGESPSGVFVQGQNQTTPPEASVEAGETHLMREGRHEQAALRFFNKINKSAYPVMYRVITPGRFVYRFEDRSYLVVAESELEQVAKEQVGRCLWMAPESILNLFLPDSEMKKPILSIASSFRKNYQVYGSIMVPDLYPEAAAFNRFLEILVPDKTRLVETVLDSLTWEQILSTKEQISHEEVVYEGESYRIFDITL